MAEDFQPKVIIAAITNVPLKLIFVVHLFFATFGIQGYWSPDSYLFYNLLFFFTLFYAIYSKDNADVPHLCLVINVLSIVFDVIALSIYFPKSYTGSGDRFSVGMAILNLVFRPVSCLALYQAWNERSSGSGGEVPNRQADYGGAGDGTYQ